MEELIVARDIFKSFHVDGKELLILKGVNLSVRNREMVAIMGASGVGKSTLLHILGALDKPTSGEVVFAGVNIFAKTDDELAVFRNRKIGFVFQYHHLLPELDALENTVMPAMIHSKRLSEASLRRAEDLLAAVGLKDRLHHRPGELSGGEQQRVAIARALMTGPALILADEPTGNLDTHTGEEVFSLFREINSREGTTIVVVTHNEKLALQADRIIHMVDGQITDQ